MVTQQQLAKAKMRALAQGVRVWALESEPMSRYAVPSTSMDGTAYEVIVYNLAEGDGPVPALHPSIGASANTSGQSWSGWM
jgi:hypothetical protein